MEVRTASRSPPMTLKQRETLEATAIQFVVLPLPSVFVTSALDVVNKDLLKVFINRVLSKIDRPPTIDVPTVGNWGLKGSGDAFLDLNSWDPLHNNQEVYRVVKLPPTSHGLRVIHIELNDPASSDLPGGTGVQIPATRPFELSNQQAYELPCSFLVVVIHLEVKVGPKKKKRIEETIHHVLLPESFSVSDLMRTFDVGGNTGSLFQIPESTNLRLTGNLTCKDLGWRHGTELRLETW